MHGGGGGGGERIERAPRARRRCRGRDREGGSSTSGRVPSFHRPSAFPIVLVGGGGGGFSPELSIRTKSSCETCAYAGPVDRSLRLGRATRHHSKLLHWLPLHGTHRVAGWGHRRTVFFRVPTPPTRLNRIRVKDIKK